MWHLIASKLDLMVFVLTAWSRLVVIDDPQNFNLLALRPVRAPLSSWWIETRVSSAGRQLHHRASKMRATQLASHDWGPHEHALQMAGSLFAEYQNVLEGHRQRTHRPHVPSNNALPAA